VEIIAEQQGEHESLEDQGGDKVRPRGAESGDPWGFSYACFHTRRLAGIFHGDNAEGFADERPKR
jgi:hypothetical protein